MDSMVVLLIFFEARVAATGIAATAIDGTRLEQRSDRGLD
jgi:hypothetical protein